MLTTAVGFTISGVVMLIISKVWRPAGIDEVDELDIFGTFGPANAPLEEGRPGRPKSLAETEFEADIEKGVPKSDGEAVVMAVAEDLEAHEGYRTLVADRVNRL